MLYKVGILPTLKRSVFSSQIRIIQFRFNSNTNKNLEKKEPEKRLPKEFKLSSSLPNQYKPKKDLPSEAEWKHLKQHIPGETSQKDDLKSRIPMFPLAKEVVTTLLPRPGVPRVGKQYKFSQVIEILKNKKQPELIYESEPHRLYFLASFCFAVVFMIYGCVTLEYAWFQSNKDWEENVEELDSVLRTREWVFSFLKHSALSALIFSVSFFALKVPSRLIRRMWYLPGPKPHIKFSSYSMLPGSPTPVYTVPIELLSRRDTARVWTGKGFYGTSDNSLFFWVLKEKLVSGGKKNWLIDRRGFFWSDGRVFDYLFGNETLAESEAGIPYDEQFGIINRELKKKKQEQREKYGFFWKFKLGAKEVKEDVKTVKRYVAGQSRKQIGKPKSKDSIVKK